jgi:hypothetical protein
VIGADAYVVEEKRDRRQSELACADEERALELTLQYKVNCVNAFRSKHDRRREALDMKK